jgi:hypothetical protein
MLEALRGIDDSLDEAIEAGDPDAISRISARAIEYTGAAMDTAQGKVAALGNDLRKRAERERKAAWAEYAKYEALKEHYSPKSPDILAAIELAKEQQRRLL